MPECAVCCFCGETVTHGLQPIVLPLADGGAQALSAHATCLQSRLHPSVPYLTPDEASE